MRRSRGKSRIDKMAESIAGDIPVEEPLTDIERELIASYLSQRYGGAWQEISDPRERQHRRLAVSR